jgi:hypothetical protein
VQRAQSHDKCLAPHRRHLSILESDVHACLRVCMFDMHARLRVACALSRYRAQVKDARRKEGDDVREDRRRPEHDGIRRGRRVEATALARLVRCPDHGMISMWPARERGKKERRERPSLLQPDHYGQI